MYPHHCRNLSGIPEGVWQPELLTGHSEFLLVEPLAVEELPDEGLPAWNVAVHLHPRTAHGEEFACLHLQLHALKQFRIILLAPRPLLCLEEWRKGGSGVKIFGNLVE